MKRLPIVALIGQTNAGKSSLLNRLARSNIAIVAREQGTTRDNVVATIDNQFILIDTAGLKDPEDDFEASIQDQIEDAINTADLILLTMDSTKYPDQKDKQIAKKALKSKKPVLLILNKSDQGTALDFYEFRSLGIKEQDSLRTSATTGSGCPELKDRIKRTLEIVSFEGHPQTAAEVKRANPVKTGVSDAVRKRDDDSVHTIKLALIGRPNVGKSSLFNSLAKKQQALVSSRQGTTRDVNRVQINYKKQAIEILDTAGLRKPGKREVGIEKFSAIRTLAAIEEADVCALLVDVTEPHAKFDQTLAGEIIKAGKSIIVVVTKTDLLENSDVLLDNLERDFNFIPYAPALLVSNKTGKNVTQLFELATQIIKDRAHQIPTNELNQILQAAKSEHPPAGLKNTRPKPKYIVQTDTNPPWFVVHGHELQLIHWSYTRFLERKIREHYPYIGTPIFLSFKNDQN